MPHDKDKHEPRLTSGGVEQNDAVRRGQRTLDAAVSEDVRDHSIRATADDLSAELGHVAPHSHGYAQDRHSNTHHTYTHHAQTHHAGHAPQTSHGHRQRRAHGRGGHGGGHHTEDHEAWYEGASHEAQLLLRRSRSRLHRVAHFFHRLGDLTWRLRGPSWIPRVMAICGMLLVLAGVGMSVLWWRLGSGPISLDIATPWLAAAVEDNFGKDYKVAIGGTQIERGDYGRAAIRIRDIVVRDREGNVVASAPKAEVGVSLTGLMTGRLRAERLSLVGAELAVRIEEDGRVTIFAGTDSRPIASTAMRGAGLPITAASGAQQGNASSASGQAPPIAESDKEQGQEPARPGMEGLQALFAWIDGLTRSGLDGHDLDELGLKDGRLVVDDRQGGTSSTFENISLSLKRQRAGGVVLGVGSASEERPWQLLAAVGPPSHGVRSFEIDADRVSIKDMLLSLRMSDMAYTADLPISGRIKGEIGRDGMPTFLTGNLLATSGSVIDKKVPEYPMPIDRIEMQIEWDAGRRVMVAPFQVVSGDNRITLLAHVEPPNGQVPHWQMGLSGGTILLSGYSKEAPLIFNRIAVRVLFDTDHKRIALERADISDGTTSVAGSGAIDYSGDEPRLSVGFAGTPMSLVSLKRLWPIAVAPEVREWVIGHISKGAVKRIEIGVNAPIKTLARGGPPIPEDGLSVELVGSGVTLQPVAGLPPIRGAEMHAHVTGRTATVTVGPSTIETPANRKLALNDLLFEVQDMSQKPPQARVHFRLEGQVPAAAEVLAMDRLSSFSGTPVDPNASKGTLSAYVTLAVPLKRDLHPGETGYTLNVDLTNFAADRMVMKQKLEANTLKIMANNEGFQIKGDVKINGLPATIDYRKPRGRDDAEIRLSGVLDDSIRARFGFDAGSSLSGAIPVKVMGNLGAEGQESRFAVEADLTNATIDNALPGWAKAPGRPMRATFNVTHRSNGTRVDDIVIDGSGTQIKGSVELDQNSEFVSASFPTFNPSEGDKATFKAERATDGALKIVMRGDIFDGRGFIKGAVAGQSRQKGKAKQVDFDLDLKLGAVAGFHGEALRGVDIKLSRRKGVIRSFAMNAKIGRDTPLLGDLRGRAGAREVIYIETNDAGAFFRFTDTYAKLFGGKMWVAMDVTDSETAPQEGLLNVRDFTVRGEGALDRVAANGAAGAARGIGFSHMRVEFTRQPGLLTIRDGVVRGPTIGATIDGDIDYYRGQVRMRGTFVPLYGLNNIFGQIPIVGIFLGGGSNEGLLGVTYEVVGSPGAPVLRVNPISAVAPGLLRKFFEFPNGRRGAPITENTQEIPR